MQEGGKFGGEGIDELAWKLSGGRNNNGQGLRAVEGSDGSGRRPAGCTG